MTKEKQRKYPEKPDFLLIPQAVLQLAQFCKEVGLFHVVVSPGSRSAPLVLALSRVGGMHIQPAMDERSAAYIALGLSLGLQTPVLLVCTSGTATMNYGPAIAEAFYQQVPLFVCTADRPPEWIDQQEGQAIRQIGIFANHAKFSAHMPSTDESPAAAIHSTRIINQAYYQAITHPPGPVHLNFPFREPLYPDVGTAWPIYNGRRVARRLTFGKNKLDRVDISRLTEVFLQSSRRLVVVGHHLRDKELTNALTALAEYGNVVVAGDFLNNLRGIPGLIHQTDWFSESFWKDENALPDILITLGKGLLSKPLKKFLADMKPVNHWHLVEDGFPHDPSGTITEIIQTKPSELLSSLAETVYFQNSGVKETSVQFLENWIKEEERAIRFLEAECDATSWSDLVAIRHIVVGLPSVCSVFVGNSMPVRYASWVSYLLQNQHHLFSNRGASGIDGCVSTAVGLAMANSEKPLIAIVGDMSFFYDRNGLWSENLPSNFKVAVINNHAGNIFRILPGSGGMKELEPLFEMHQPLQAERTALDARMAYFKIDSKEGASDVVTKWLAAPSAALLECYTDKYVNADVVKNLKKRASERG